VTLKLKPRPEAQALLALRCPADEVAPLLDRVHASRTRPVCVELLNAAAVRALNRQYNTQLPEAPWVVVVGFEDNRDAVNWQIQQLIRELPANPERGLDGWAGRTADRLWQALVDFRAWPGAGLTFKANQLPRAVAEFCRKAASLPEALLLQAHAGNGIVLGHATDTLTLSAAAAMLTTGQGAAEAAEGNVVLLCCPPAWKETLPVWGKPRGDLALMRRVKQQLDPRGLFNPGRFVDAMRDPIRAPLAPASGEQGRG
jgi:glycolate oxidase FAD binding subunit